MRPGGGKSKGSTFERTVGTALSLWVSEGARSDLFARTVLSGGQFTISKINEGQAGDLMGNHPLAFAFMELFSIECKFYKDLGLGKYLLDQTGKSFLAKTFKLAKEQAVKAKVRPLLIAKQNHSQAIVIMEQDIGAIAVSCSRTKAIRYHSLHNNTVMLLTLQQLVTLVKVKAFLKGVKEKK